MPLTKTSWWSAVTALVLVAALLLVPAAPALAKTEIQFWHAMTGQLGDAVNELVKQFNDSQTEYEVKPLPQGHVPGDAHRGHRGLPPEAGARTSCRCSRSAPRP